MRKLIMLFPLFFLLFGSMSFADEDAGYFPLDTGRIWAYNDGNIDQITSFLKVENGEAVVYLFAFEHNFGKRVFFREGLKIYEWRNNFRRLWYDFGANPGDSWKMTWTAFGTATGAPPEEIADINDGAEVTLVASDETISVPYHDFTGVFHFRITRPGVNDAAYVEEWFAPGIGCVQRVRDTIAGPHMQKLVKIALPEPTTPLRLEVELDKEQYAPGEDILITVSLLNRSDKEITLKFPTSFQVDYFIDGSHQWSMGRAFTEALTTVKIPARDVYTWTTFIHTAQDYRVPSGKHFITAIVVGQPLKAGQTFIVNQKFPSLPSGIKLSVKTAKNRYTQGEPIPFTLTISNMTREEITIGVLVGIPVKYWVDTQPAPGSVEPLDPTIAAQWGADSQPAPGQVEPTSPVKEVTVKPGESRTFEGVFTAAAGMLEPGGHALYAGLNGYDNVVYTKFLITRELTLGKVIGTVITYDAAGKKQPVPGAAVNLSTVIPKNFDAEFSNMPRAENMEFNTKTDDSGNFVLADVPVGVFYTLTVKKEGFFPYTETVRTLQDATELTVALKPANPFPDDELNVKRHLIAGLFIVMGTDRSAYKPDSPFKALFSITNTLKDEVKFTFDNENYVDWYLDTPDGPVQLTQDETAKTGAAAEFTMTLIPGVKRTFTRTSTFKGKVPENGGKYAVRASLRYTACSIATLKPGDVSDYVMVLVVLSESERLDACGHNKEMVLDLRSSVNAFINITTKNDGVSGEIVVTEIIENLHKPKLNARFIKMIEVDADPTIRDNMESAIIRIYFNPADFDKDFNPRNLIISHWDDKLDNPDWQDLATRIDTVNNFAEVWTNSFSSFALFDTNTGTGVNDTDVPASFRLDQNVPNPFNPVTTIQFRVPTAGQVKLTVYNITGQEAARLVDGSLAAGVYRVVFDGSRCASGVYFYRLTGNRFSQTRKMLLIK